MKNTAFIGLGSNLSYPLQQVQQELTHLSSHPALRVIKISRFYRSKPLQGGPLNQPEYVNAVVKVRTDLDPFSLLQAMQNIEKKQGRVRLPGEHWGPRCIDLDILLYNNEVIKTARLTLPHPGLKEREFVVIPLMEIEADLVLPDGDTLEEIKQRSFFPSLSVIEV